MAAGISNQLLSLEELVERDFAMKLPLPMRAIDAIESGIKTARRNPKPEGDPVPDDYIAWCVWNALRQAGFKIIDAAESLDSN